MYRFIAKIIFGVAGAVCLAASFVTVPLSRAWPRGRRWTSQALRIWFLLSFIWLSLIAIQFCQRVNDQMTMTREIALNLASLDCPNAATGSAACDGAQQVGPYNTSWKDIAGTFLSYGFRPLLVAAAAPPTVILVLGLLMVWGRTRIRTLMS